MNENNTGMSLLRIWDRALASLDPAVWLKALPRKRILEADAHLFWGKAARSTYQAVFPERPVDQPILVISPEPRPGDFQGRWVRGGHPIPDQGSFDAGAALLDFFDALRRNQCRRLNIFLSGGASSLAWIRPADLGEDELREKLLGLYRSGMDIAQMNRARSELCALKGGGAARFLKMLAPAVRGGVFVISDVYPFGPEIVGSGPFWGGGLPHRVVTDQRKWVASLAGEGRRSGWKVGFSCGSLSPWTDWVDAASARIEKAPESGKGALWILAGEPRIILPRKPFRPGAGGRQTQIAAALASRFLSELASGRFEILCGSSDGLDGGSGSGGAYLNQMVARNLLQGGERKARAVLGTALTQFRSAEALGKAGGLLPARATGTNVQDALVILFRPSS